MSYEWLWPVGFLVVFYILWNLPDAKLREIRKKYGMVKPLLLFVFLLSVVIVICFIFLPTDESSALDSFKNTKLEGEFHSKNNKLGEWTLKPKNCLNGRELGFQGIAFMFGAGEPVEEIRLDTARQGDNVVEVRLADRAGTTYRVREAECKVIEGTVKKTNLTYNRRPLQKLEGNIHFDCPDHGLSGSASFSGCLPKTF